MMQLEAGFPVPLPDDPYKWDGWSKYKSPNLYERLCLDPRANPSNELIEQHCRELMRWWQKKLPLKNQPSNPLAQILRPGLDESSRYLTEARGECGGVSPAPQGGGGGGVPGPRTAASGRFGAGRAGERAGGHRISQVSDI